MTEVTLYVGYEQTVTDTHVFKVTREMIEDFVNDDIVNANDYTLEDVLSDRENLLDIIDRAYANDMIEPTEIQETFRENNSCFFETQPNLPLFGGVEE